MKRLRITVLLAVSLSLMGAGCGPASTTTAPAPHATSTAPSAAGLSAPERVAEAFQFIADDSFEITETMPGGGVFAKDVAQPVSGTRLVTVSSFAPESTASLRWSAITDDAQHPATAVGELARVQLLRGHELLLPSAWSRATAPWIQDTSGFWVSDEVFQELVSTRQATLAFGFSDQRFQDAFSSWPAGSAFLQALQARSSAVSRHREIDLLHVDATSTPYVVAINGSPVTVSVIKAHDWFGDVVILNNRQNPIVLSFTLRQGGKSWFDYRADNFVLTKFH